MNKRDWLVATNKIRIIKERERMGWNVDEDLQDLLIYLDKFGKTLVIDEKYVYKIV